MRNRMMLRIAVAAAIMFGAGASPLSAQGRAPEKPVVSTAALKAISSQKRRSKTPMTSRVGMKRAAMPAAADSRAAAARTPTSVRALVHKR
jgi:hypothetical protein